MAEQGQSASNLNGELVQGVANAAAPTLLEGKTGPVSLDLSGRLRTVQEAGSVATYGYSATFSFTPAAAAYSANDVMSVAQQASAAIGPAAGGEVTVTGAILEVDTTGLQTGETSYNLHLYNVTPPSAHADNDAWDLPSGDRAAHICTITLPIPLDLGSTLKVEMDNINKQITLPSGSRPYAELVTVGAHTALAVLHKVTLKTVGL